MVEKFSYYKKPENTYEVIVVGAGHAGCEAALAAARMGCKTLLLTLNMDYVALMPCNPSMGGPAKGNLISELDALGGEIGVCTDKTFIQIRLLNSSKGPAVQALRAQADKKLYGIEMKKTLEQQKNLTLKQALVEDVLVEKTPRAHSKINTTVLKKVVGVVTSTGWRYFAQSVVLTTGTSLNSKIIIGDAAYSGGRSGELPAVALSVSLQKLGLRLIRWKTGTPPRLDSKTIIYAKTQLQPGSSTPLYFSWLFRYHAQVAQRYTEPPVDLSPQQEKNVQPGWRAQLPCYLIWSTEKTKKIVQANLKRAPLFSGVIQGVGPRYCPSFEAKIATFPHKKQQLFLEPEGWKTHEIYLQGANTSLPEDVQRAFVRTLPGLENVELVRLGYAIEYDGVATGQITNALETKCIQNLFLAGQINGTSGYEEAAAQGFVAGVNAVLKIRQHAPFIVRRDEAYIGVLIDDLVTQEIIEPYRLLTSRAEYRLLLRTDNADMRLTEKGHELGLISSERMQQFMNKKDCITEQLKKFKKQKVKLVSEKKSITWTEFLRRPHVHNVQLEKLVPELKKIPTEVKQQLEIQIKYEGYIEKQRALVKKFKHLEDKTIPSWINYDKIPGLRNEARERFKQYEPRSLGQAARVFGITPADVSIVMIWLETRKH